MFKLDLERQRKQRSDFQHLLDHRKSKRIPEKHLLLLYWLCQSLCVDHNKLENSESDGNTRSPDLPPKKSVCRSRSNRTGHSPLDCREIQPVHPKGNQFWIFTERADAEAEIPPILQPPDSKNWFIGKDPDAGKDWRQEEEGTTEDEMVGWHHQFDGHEFEQAPGVGDGQGSLVCCSCSCSPWGRKESDTTEWLNWTDKSNRKVCSLHQDMYIISLAALFIDVPTVKIQIPSTMRWINCDLLIWWNAVQQFTVTSSTWYLLQLQYWAKEISEEYICDPIDTNFKN